MKKYFYLFLSLFAVILFSCDQNTPSDPSNTTNNSSNTTDSSDISNPSIINKVKYLKESASWFTYQDTESGSTWSTGLNVVSKYVYERGKETKYLKSESRYENDELVSKRTYQNESDRDYSWVSYPSASESSKDTTIWYDEARTKYKEIRNKTYRSVYEYDKQHNERQLSIKTYYHHDNLWSETIYNYDGLIRYGESKFYNSGDRNLSTLHKYSDEFMDDTFTRLKSLNTEMFTYISESKSYRSGISRISYEWDGKLLTKTTADYEYFDQQGNSIQTIGMTTTYTWSDELNNTSETEYKMNGSLCYRQSGYNKYTY